jgi:hypothetical protein
MLQGDVGSQHPLHYLILARFAELDAPTLFGNQELPMPFGEPPWPCLNPVGGHYQRQTINDCSIRVSWNAKSLVGEFACDLCGMKYERCGPDQGPQDRYRRDHVPQFGSAWERSLRELWLDPAISLRSAAETLGVDPRTLRIQALRLGFEGSRPGSKVGPPRQKEPIRILQSQVCEMAKSEWCNLRHGLPNATIAELRRKRPALYTSLYRQCHEWFSRCRQNMRIVNVRTVCQGRPPGQPVCTFDLSPRLDSPQKPTHQLRYPRNLKLW